MAGIALSTSHELWEALWLRAGLTPSSNETVASYDDAFEDELRNNLFGGAEGDFGDLLTRNAISPERLLNCFFRALAPFPRMMSQILAMFEMAGTAHSDDNIRISIDVDAIEAPLEFDLDHFREVVRRFENVLRMVRVRSWRNDFAWSLDEIILSSGALPDFYYGSEERPEPSSAEVQAWLESTVTERDFRGLPPAVPTGLLEFDNLVSDLWADFDDFQSTLRERFGSYAFLSSAPTEAPDFRGWDWNLLRFAAHDLWPRRTVELLALLGDVLRREPSNAEALECVASLVAKVASFTSPPQPLEVQIEILEDILSLPVWQKRHELYAVWVASLITRTLSPYDIEFHCDGGVLSFPFRATHLASIGHRARERLELWSELRTPAVRPTGKRVASVQPDYRLRRPAPGPIGDVPDEADLLVIECKQYKRSSTRNFSAALTDYARAATAAQVALWNYGPVSPRVRAAVCDDVVERCHPVGDVQPTGTGLAEARAALSSVAEAAFEVELAQHWAMARIEIELRWDGDGVDLDLFVTSSDGACGYDSPNGLEGVTFGSDDLGNGRGQHVEKLTLSPLESVRYDVVVRVHSGASNFQGLQCYLAISWLDIWGDGHSRIIHPCPTIGRDWYVAAFREGLSGPVEINRPAEGFVSGSGWTSESGSGPMSRGSKE